MSCECEISNVFLNGVECFFEFRATSNVCLFGCVLPLPYFVCGALTWMAEESGSRMWLPLNSEQ